MSFIGLSLCICTTLFHVNCCMRECSWRLSHRPTRQYAFFVFFYYMWIEQPPPPPRPPPKKLTFGTVAMLLYLISHQVSPLTRASNYFNVYRVIEKKMNGIWNRYNLKSTRGIYTFGVLKCSEKFKVLDLPQYIWICATFVALETSKPNSISCHVF